QLVERPYRLLERNTNHTLDRLRELPIRNGIAGNIDDLINDARFGKQYFRGELSDIFRRRNGDLRIPATQPVDGSAFKIYDPKRRVKQEAGEHAGGHNHPIGSGLAAQQPSDLVLLIEHRLSAAATHHVIIDTELPRKVPPDACREY